MLNKYQHFAQCFISGAYTVLGTYSRQSENILNQQQLNYFYAGNGVRAGSYNPLEYKRVYLFEKMH